MNTMVMKVRQEVSILLVFTMLFSCWLVMPMPAKAGFLSTVGKVAKAVVVTAGSIAAGYMGGVLGIALGGGPIGMVAGAVGGFIVGKKLLGWATSSFANAATVAGAVGGGLLMAGMGFPLLAVGVVVGAVAGRLITKLIAKVFGKKTLSSAVVQVPGSDPEMDKKCQDFITSLKTETAATTSTVSANVQTAVKKVSSTTQDSYNKYLASYKAYMEATTKGNNAAAKAAFTEYQKNLAAYQASMSGS